MFVPHSSANNYVNEEIPILIMIILKWASKIACRRLLKMFFCFHHLLKVMFKNLLLLALYVEIMSIAVQILYHFFHLTTAAESLPKRHLYQVCP